VTVAIPTVSVQRAVLHDHGARADVGLVAEFRCRGAGSLTVTGSNRERGERAVERQVRTTTLVSASR
jgi:hypothetical protein